MSDIVIKIENLSKQYRLGKIGTGTLSHDLNRWWATSVLGKEDPYLKIGETNVQGKRGGSEYVWALKDINLEVKQGEVLGIIGKNGAGKSTLLKILSRVTKPTTGTIEYKGRIASLLEVGTGFHPEMTGRENIFMNGSIMGMTKAEITRKLDEIIDFAGVERYIDTPVKRYSSGMTVRLGFAIAAHLEPEILVVDEVLAVGDAEFQKKAIGKMQDVSREGGRTVLFVSHNMAAIEKLCQKCLLINEGLIIQEGNVNQIISQYLKLNIVTSNAEINKRKDRKGDARLIFTNVAYYINNIAVSTIKTGQDIIFRISFNKNTDDILENCRISIAINKDEQQFIVLSSELIIYNKIQITKSGYIDFILYKCPLTKGTYFLDLFIESNNVIMDWISKAAIIQVEDGDFFGTGKSYPNGWEGKTVLVNHSIKVSD